MAQFDWLDIAAEMSGRLWIRSGIFMFLSARLIYAGLHELRERMSTRPPDPLGTRSPTISR
jgi:hypothetical protein